MSCHQLEKQPNKAIQGTLTTGDNEPNENNQWKLRYHAKQWVSYSA